MTSPSWAGGDFQSAVRNAGGVALCGACARTGLCHLGVATEILGEDNVARFELICPGEFEGGPGVAHGGWTAAVLDEAMGHVPILHGHLTVTGTLTVHFVRPVPVRHPLVLHARAERVDGKKWRITGELLLASSGAELATGVGMWIEREREAHFGGFQQWLQEQGSEEAILN